MVRLVEFANVSFNIIQNTTSTELFFVFTLDHYGKVHFEENQFIENTFVSVYNI